MSLPDRPTATARVRWSPPVPTITTLKSGAPVYAHVDRGLPLVSLRIELPFGSVIDPPARAGLVALTASMMEESSGDLDTLARSAALDRLAARFGVQPGREWTTVALDVHRDRLLPALPLVADAVFRPQFRAEDFDRVRARHVTGIAQGLDDNAFVAAQVSAGVLFGDDHPYGHAVHGTIAMCEAADLDGVRSIWAQGHARPPRFVVVGDVDLPVLVAALDALWSASSAAPTSMVPAGPLPARPGRWFVHSPGSAQTVVRVMRPGPAGAAPDRYAIELARVALGGSFTSRLNRRLREEKGYTYGARLAVAAWEKAGMVAATASVRADSTADALLDTISVLAEARSGFLDAEVDRSRAQSLQDLVDASENRAGLAAAYAGEIEAGRDPAQLAAIGAALETIDEAAMRCAAADWFDPGEASVVLVGDRDAVMPSLEAAGFQGWVDLAPGGDPPWTS